jgi:chemotaxis protein CheD
MEIDTIAVGLGDIKCSKNRDSVLVCYGLGSCVGISMYDPRTHIGGMAHVVLPDSSILPGSDIPGKFADTAVPALLNGMLELGAHKTSIVVKIAGGAKMFTSSPGLSSVLDVGSKNVEAVKKALKASRLRIAGEDCGGSCGRTFHLFLAEGRVSVRTLGRSEIDL